MESAANVSEIQNACLSFCRAAYLIVHSNGWWSTICSTQNDSILHG